MPVKNICNCHEPPGGQVTCEPHQMAVCMVLNGVVTRGCKDPPSSGDAKLLANWALAQVIGTERQPDYFVGRGEVETLESGRFERGDGAIVTFALPENIAIAVRTLIALPVLAHALPSFKRPPTLDWHDYKTGGLDRAGRSIEKVYALDDNYVIYICDCELFYETKVGLVKDLGPMNAALARINRLLPDNPKNKDGPTYRNKFSTLELVGDAFEMAFCGETEDAMDILNGIRDKLQTAEEGKRRLMYQFGSVAITIAVWVVYAFFHNSEGANPWILTAGLALAGGVFSVCLNLGSLQVNVNQSKPFLFSAGATRSVVALLAGIALLLAMRSKMFAGIVYSGQPPDGGVPPAIGSPLTVVEMFFCYLAGFSESFVPNILRSTEKKADDSGSPNEAGKPGSTH